MRFKAHVPIYHLHILLEKALDILLHYCGKEQLKIMNNCEFDLISRRLLIVRNTGKISWMHPTKWSIVVGRTYSSMDPSSCYHSNHCFAIVWKPLPNLNIFSFTWNLFEKSIISINSFANYTHILSKKYLESWTVPQ